MTSTIPLGGNFDRVSMHIEDRRLPNPAQAPSPDRYAVSPIIST